MGVSGASRHSTRHDDGVALSYCCGIYYSRACQGVPAMRVDSGAIVALDAPDCAPSPDSRSDN